MVEDDRRHNLRRLDDLLDALEQLNLTDRTELTAAIGARLNELQVPTSGKTISQMIDSVLDLQAEYLIKVPVERRRSPRRRSRVDISKWLRESSGPRA